MIYELRLIGRTSTNILKVVLGLRTHVAPSGPKYKRNEIELRSFHHSIRLEELIILVWSFVQIGYKVTKLWPPEVWPKVAVRPFLAILAIFLEIDTYNLFFPTVL